MSLGGFYLLNKIQVVSGLPDPVRKLAEFIDTESGFKMFSKGFFLTFNTQSLVKILSYSDC